MTTTRIVTAPIENKPGTLAQITKALGKENINIEAIESEAIGEYGYVRLLTDNPEKTQKVLKNQGLSVTTTEFVELSVPNEPGELGRICERLAQEKINIESLFATTGETPDEGRILIRTNDVAKADRALQGISARAVAR